jgi:hypothetical protein
MTHLLRGTSLESSVLSVQPQVIRLEQNFLDQRPRRVYSPKGDLVIGSIIEKRPNERRFAIEKGIR